MHKIILKQWNMARTFLICCCLLCFLASCCSGQSSKVLSGDTTFWYKLQNEKCEKLKLPQLISSSDNFHFRFWTDQQSVDIWTSDGITFNGLVTSYINSYVENDKKKPSKKTSETFLKQVSLDTAEARKAFYLTKHIAAIPTDKSIKGWVQGFDGTEYLIETSTLSTYNIRAYWTPTAQDSSLAEAKKIRSFIKDLDSLLGLPRKYNEFFATLKPGPYTGGSMLITKLTKKQSEYFKRTKPYRDYLESVRDTLNHYLSDTLTKTFAKYGALQCYDEFFLKFSRNNRLLKITTNSEFTDREDKKQYRDCKKKIAAAFKLIRIDFVHSQVAYWRELTFWDGKVDVFDNSIRSL